MSLNQNNTNVITIKHLANHARAKMMLRYGEAGFAKICMEFDSNLVPEGICDEEGELGDIDDDLSYIISVVKLMAHSPDRELFLLGMIWLDGKGFGSVTSEQLDRWFKKYRSGSYS